MIGPVSKWLLRLLLVLLVLCVLAAGVVVFVLNTESGTRWIISRADDAFPGALEITDFDGTLWQGLQIDTLTYANEKQLVEIEGIAFDLHWPSVLAGRIVFETFQADTVSRRSLKPKPPQPEPFELAMNPLPVYIGVERGSIDELIIIGADSRREITGIEVRKLGIVGNRFRATRATGSSRGVFVSLANLSIALRGSVPVSGAVSWRLPDNDWSGQGRVGGNLAEVQVRQELSGPYPAAVSGQLHILGRIEPAFDALVNWERWHIGGQDFEDGEIRVSGTAAEFDAEYVTSVVIADQALHINGTATGNTDALSRVDALVTGRAGELELSGRLTRKPEFSAEAAAEARDIDPSVFRDSLRGRLQATARLLVDEDYAVTIRDLAVDGSLNDAPVSANGQLFVTREQLRCRNCVVSIGKNRLTIDGENVNGSLRLALNLNAPALEQLWPGLGGSAVGNATLQGSFEDPRVTGNVTLRDVEYKDSQYGNFVISLDGSRSAADVEASWTYDDFSATANGELKLEDQLISGRVRRATITKTDWDSWVLQDPFDFRIAGRDISVTGHEWHSELGDVRISRFNRTADTLSAVAVAENIPLDFINSRLPPNYKLSGVGSADLDLSYEAGLWLGAVNWEQANTVLRVVDANGDTTDVVVRRAEVHANFRDGGMVANAAVEVDPGVLGEIDLQLENLKRNAPMTGTLRLQGEDWSWISAVVPQIDRFEGAITADIRAKGPLDSPAFSGTANWVDGGVVVPASNVLLKDIQMEIEGAPDGDATVSGSAKAGSGSLKLSGRLSNLTQESRSVTFMIEGDNAELIDWPEYHVWGSPEIELAGRPGDWQIKGELKVPRAELSLPEKPRDAVTESPDVVVLGEENNANRATRITGETRVILGDRVHFAALGLDTRLLGNVLLKQAAGRPMTAEGRLELVDGTYEAYGKELTIEEGELVFTGPLDDPLVNVRAGRVIETLDGNVTAGVHLRGRAQNLTTTVYSNPAMPDADALAYLVLGRPLDQATDSDGFEVSNAAIALGIRQAGRITDEIGQSLGLDELSLAGDGGDTTALVAGKQINSRLHARYAYGVFSRLGTLLLRYRLSRHLTLEAGAGENQSIDVLYSIEK